MEVIPLKEKVRRSKRENKTQKEKKESAIVTKESICATFALFFFLGFTILCSRSLIFGGFGEDVHAVLTGVFGYMAYPLFLGAIYLCVMGLLGKSLVRNKKAGWLIALTLVCVALVVHTALSFFRFDEKGYLSYCFNAGKTFPETTVFGWLGGVVVFALAELVTQIGVLVIFSLLAVLFGYFSVASIRKSAKTKAAAQDTPEAGAANPTMEIPLSNAQDPVAQTPVQPSQPVQSQSVPMNNGSVNDGRTAQGYQTPSVAQRPGVRLYETTEQDAQNKPFNNGFSPFGNNQPAEQSPVDDMAASYERSRAFLFGGAPAENYRRNLLFDPNANVNKRPPVEPAKPNTAYVPSYVNAYENSVNENTQPARPVKVVRDNTQNNGYAATEYAGYGERTKYAPPVQPTQPVQPSPPVEEQPTVRETPSYSALEERNDFGRTVSAYEQPTPTVKEEPEVKPKEGNSYRRHEYMDLFSMSNPNVLGREEDREPFPEESFEERGRAFGRESDEERGGRDGLHLFDEEEETGVRGFGRDFSTDRTSRDDFSTVRGDFSRMEQDEVRGGLFSERSMREVDFDNPFETPSGEIPVAPAQSDQPIQTDREEFVKPLAEPAPVPKKPRVFRPYVRVPLDDFDCRDIAPTSNQMEVEETKENIISTLEDFKVTGASIASVTFGPTVTRYNVTLPRSISPKKVVALDQSIAISLHSSGVNVYPNYEDGVVSIEVPNKERQFVQLGCMLSADTFVNAKPSSLMFAMGKDVANKKVYGDISKMIHLLVAGSSGSGKSVFLGSLIISLIYKYSPEELRLILIDPKKTEFVLYNNLPHLMIDEIITDVGKAVQSLNWAIGEMNRRYGLFEQMSKAGTYVVNLDQYNEQVEKKDRLPKIVIIIDELADLMLAAKKEMEDRIQNLTQKARAAGIHLIVATQRPSTDVITGVIKSNLPTRVAFYVASDVDSRVILDQTGAQKLLGKGDFLYTMPGLAAPARVQSAFISPEESQRVVNFIKNNNEAYYDEEATAFINSRGGNGGGDASGGNGEREFDPMYIEALRHVILNGSASISMIQRKCSAGYNRAGKIVEWMEEMGYISPFDGAKARKVLITKEEFESKYGPL